MLARYVDWNKISKQQIFLVIVGPNKALNELPHITRQEFCFALRTQTRPWALSRDHFEGLCSDLSMLADFIRKRRIFGNDQSAWLKKKSLLKLVVYKLIKAWFS